MKRKAFVICTVVTSVLLGAWFFKGDSVFMGAAIATTAKPQLHGVEQSSSKQPAPFRQGTAGKKIHVDPQTGRIIPPPPGAFPTSQLSPQMRNALSRSSQGLVRVRRPDGGSSVNLQGRFRSATVATVTPDGKVVTSCLSGLGHKHAQCEKTVNSSNESQK